MSIEEDKDFNFDDVILDILSSGTSIRLQSQLQSLRGARLKSRLQSMASVRSGILHSRSYQIL